jgi:hypothetical protein
MAMVDGHWLPILNWTLENSDRKKQLALEFIWNSFIMIWLLIRKVGSSNCNGYRSLTSYFELNLGEFRPEKTIGFGIRFDSFIMIWSLIRKGGSSDGNGSPVIDFLFWIESWKIPTRKNKWLWNSFGILSLWSGRLLEKEAALMAMVARSLTSYVVVWANSSRCWSATVLQCDIKSMPPCS